MHHASIQTTMNVYGQAMPESKEKRMEGCHDGAQAVESERLKVPIFLIRSKWE